MNGDKDKHRRAWNGEIGPLLTEARERQGISLKEAEQVTKIRCGYLEGLEREDLNELPGKSYVQGFLSSYGEFLGLDAEELSNRFNRYNGEHRQRRARLASLKKDRPTKASISESDGYNSTGLGSLLRNSRSGTLFALSLVILVLALAVSALYLLRGDSLQSESPVAGQESPRKDVPGEAKPGEIPSAENGGGVSQTLKEDPKPESGREGHIRATVLVRGAESWVSVESGSGVEYTGIAQPGFSRSFEPGQYFRITTGNAGAVELRINGIDYGTLGENGEVTSRSFTFKRER